MDINVWQKLFVESCEKKFPIQFTPEQRLLAIQRQLADVSQTIQFGEIGGITLQHRIAAVLPDLFMLCEQHDVNLNEELATVLAWFNSDSPKSERG